jgi:epoxyqueuosine reductase QueG
MRCRDACPVKALGGEDYPEGICEKKTCAARSEALNHRSISPCGLCIRVCPVGSDRARFGREDLSIYHENDARFSAYHRAWKHVRSYGGR